MGESGIISTLKVDDLLFLAITASVAAMASFLVFASCFYWFRREQKRAHKKLLKAVSDAGRDPDDVIVTGRDALSSGELVAQFKVNQGKQVVSLLESDGKRFIHVEGELSAPERARMVRYLKSEGFMS
jgi:hypothetical protein